MADDLPPLIDAMEEDLPTSVLLRRAERELAESQAAFEETYRDWETTAKRLRETARDLDDARAAGHGMSETLARTRAELVQVRAQRDHLSAQLDAALAELAEVRSWQVAAQDAGPCACCGGPIVQSQGVKLMPGTTKPRWAHVHCPTPEGEPT